MLKRGGWVIGQHWNVFRHDGFLTCGWSDPCTLMQTTLGSIPSHIIALASHSFCAGVAWDPLFIDSKILSCHTGQTEGPQCPTLLS